MANGCLRYQFQLMVSPEEDNLSNDDSTLLRCTSAQSELNIENWNTLRSFRYDKIEIENFECEFKWYIHDNEF